MATASANPSVRKTTPFAGAGAPVCPPGNVPDHLTRNQSAEKFSQQNAFEALLAFCALLEQVRRRKTEATNEIGVDKGEELALGEVLQIVVERALTITGADGAAIALAENYEIVLWAAGGTVRPDLGARIDRDSAFSGACFRMAQIVRCDDTETDARVNAEACRRLGARSMAAVPLCGRQGGGIGVLEAFSADPFGFDDNDVCNLSLLAETLVGALDPQDEARFAESAQIATKRLDATPGAPEAASAAAVPPQVIHDEPPHAALFVITKPVEEEIRSAAEGAILHEPTLESESPLSDVVPPETNDPAAEPEVQTERTSSAVQPLRIMVLLLCIVILALIAGGIWRRVKARQAGSAISPTEEIAAKPAGTAARDATTAAPSAVGGVAASPATISLEANADGSHASNSHAEPLGLSKFPRITGIQHYSSPNSSTVVLNLEDQVQYEAHRLNDPDRIYFDLHDTQLASGVGGKSIEVGDATLVRIRAAETAPGKTRIVLETTAKTDFSVRLEPSPYRLVVEVRKIAAKPKGAVNPSRKKTKLAIVVPPARNEDSELLGSVPKMRIVVDAGHGGRDQGTVGRDGLLEKDLVLEIAQRLGKLLESRLGMDVIYTREDDTYVPLDERASIANQAQADLFISVHANYSDFSSARGVETYYTNSFTTPGAKDVDSRPGASDTATASLSPPYLQERTDLSRKLAASVQHSLYGTLSAQNPGLRDRGIKEADFVVLTESAMPGILAEVSFVSSPADEKKLRSDGYREQVAEALYQGIARYAASSNGVKLASSGR